MNWQPLVSIIIPVYNGANYLRQAIDSALAQTYPNCEVLVVNDGSNDNGQTEAIALSYGERIRYFRKENGGVSSALNFGIQEMRGDYFAWLSHDDLYLPEKIQRQVEIIRTCPGDAVLYGDFLEIDEQSQQKRVIKVPSRSPLELRLSLLESSPIHGCSVLLNRKCFEKVGLFDESLRVVQDFDMWMRLSRHYDFIHIPEALIKSRIHSMQGSVIMKSSHFDEKTEFFKRYLTEIASENRVKNVEKYLLKNAISLSNGWFYDAASCGYGLALEKIKDKKNKSLEDLRLLLIYLRSRSIFSSHYCKYLMKKILLKFGFSRKMKPCVLPCV